MRFTYWHKILLSTCLFAGLGLDAKNYSASVDVKKKAARDAVMKYQKEADKDFAMKFHGRIREEFYLWEKPFLFGADSDDVGWYFRSKVEAGVRIKQGLKTYGTPAAEAAVNFTSYSYWQANNAYDRHTREVGTLSGLDGAVTSDKHSHSDILPRVFLSEAWYKINFGVLVDCLKNYPISLTVGYFPYLVGRGLSLGAHEDLAHTHVGWQGEGNFTTFPSRPPGILIRGKISDNFSWDLYYNKWRANNYEIERVLTPVYANRVNWPTIYRGKDKDRDTFVVRADLKNKSEKTGNTYIQPYFVYTRAPELPIESDADSKARLGTVGCMTEWKKGGWDVNVEFAGQYGTQELFNWDRNTITLVRDPLTGNVQEKYSHLLLNNPSSGSKATVTAEVMNAANLSRNRLPSRNGQPLLDSNNREVMQNGFRVYNSNLWGNPRIRPSYKVNYGGLMGIADVAYTFSDIPLKAAFTTGYIGGDKYPYNTEEGSNLEKDKTYKGFIAQRAYYSGRHVHSIMIFDQLVIPRPTNIVNRYLFAENNYRDYSNLQFIGTNVVWNPLAQKDKLAIEPNIFGYWEVSQIKKWDKNATHPDPVIRAALNRLGVKGWMSDQDASKFLGVELNTIVTYKLLKNCSLYSKAWAFKPGKLYEDISGQPSSFGRRKTPPTDTAPNGSAFILSPGTEVSWGFCAGIDYHF